MATAFFPAHLFAESITLAEVLAPIPQYARLSIRLVDSQHIQGQFISVTPDLLTLQTGANTSSQRAFPLHHISRVQRWQANLGRSTQNGALGGAIVLGSLGLMAGLSLNETYGEQSYGVTVLVTGIGAGLGALAGGVLGLATGLLSRSWQDLWPTTPAPPRPQREYYSQNTRVSLTAGFAHSWLENYKVNRFAGRIAFLNNANSVVRIGPEISFVDFGGVRSSEDRNGTVQRNKVNSIFRAALSFEAGQPGEGTLPYVNLGIGGTASNDLSMSGHLGGGLRKRRANGSEFDLDLRFNFNFTDTPAGEVGSFWTLGLGFGFGL